MEISLKLVIMVCGSLIIKMIIKVKKDIGATTSLPVEHNSNGKSSPYDLVNIKRSNATIDMESISGANTSTGSTASSKGSVSLTETDVKSETKFSKGISATDNEGRSLTLYEGLKTFPHTTISKLQRRYKDGINKNSENVGRFVRESWPETGYNNRDLSYVKNRLSNVFNDGLSDAVSRNNRQRSTSSSADYKTGILGKELGRLYKTVTVENIGGGILVEMRKNNGALYRSTEVANSNEFK